MKKHLIAAAVAAAVAAPAMAQVTIYGAVDAGMESFKTGAAVGGDTFSRSTHGRLSTNRIGFRGTEDLGGGLKAEFMIQGATGFGPSAPGNISFNEEQWVGLSGGFGHIRFGTTDMTAAEGVDSFTSNGAGNFGNFGTITALNGELGGNQPGTIRYISPTFSGIQVQAAYATGNANTTGADGRISQQGVSVSYTAGPLGLIAGYQTADGATGGVSDRDSKTMGIRYNAGFAQVGLAYAKADLSTTTDSDDVTMVVANLAMPIGKTTLHVLYHSGKSETVDVKGSGTTLMVKYPLSKRTTIYGYMSDVDSESAGRFAVNNVTAGANGSDPRGFGFGVSHGF